MSGFPSGQAQRSPTATPRRERRDPRARARPPGDRSLATLGLLALFGARGLPARAQVRLGTVAVEAERESEAPEPGTGAASVSVVDPRAPSARAASVADAVGSEPGLQLRSYGGLGAFTSASIRGSNPNQVAVFLDGVPLSRAVAGTVDLAVLPTTGLERIEIYRGVPPIELGSDAIGGAINLVTRAGGAPGLRLSIGGGSFGARSASLGYHTGGDGARALRADLSAAYHGATGDFLYYDGGGTQDTSDDRLATRRNNRFDQLALDATVSGPLERGGRWFSGAHGFLKVQGVPGRGFDGAESTRASLGTGRLAVTGGAERSGFLAPWLDGRVDLSLLYERGLFRNPGGEQVGVFLRSATDLQTVAAGVRARLRAQAGAHELFTVFASVDGERFEPGNLVQRVAGAPSSRVRVALALADEIRLAGDRIAITPSVRLDGTLSELAPGIDVRGNPRTPISTTSAFASPRLAVRARPWPWLSLVGDVGWFQRQPSTLELFGDGAFVLPRPDLVPETSWSGDLGARVDLAGTARGLGPSSLSLEGTFFGRAVRNLILLAPAQYALEALNLGDDPPVRVLGLEAIARARVGRHALISADYTLLDGRNSGGGLLVDTDGKQLPGVPRHRVNARAELRAGPLSCFYELAWQSDAFRDLQNTVGNVIPARALHAIGASAGPLGARFLPGGYRMRLALEVRNLADLRVVPLPPGGIADAGRSTPYPLVDLYDYPLPGRAVYATLSLDH